MPEAPPPSNQGLPSDLRRWVAAGLITDEQAAAIGAYEGSRAADRKQGRATRAIALLGGLTLISGVGSLVAYNWDKFGGGVKLFALGLLLASAIGATLRARERQTTPVSAAFDVSALIVMGLTIAGLALVSQVYNQDGELWVLLFWWCALTAPLMSFTRTRFAHHFWYGALFISLMTSADAFDGFIEEMGWGYRASEMAVALIYGGLTLSLAARFAASRHLGRSTVGLSLYHFHLIALGLLGGLAWHHGDDGQPLLWLVGLCVTGAVAAATPESVERLGWGKRSAVLTLLILASVLFVLPLGLPVDTGFGAFIAFVLFWGLAWHFAEKNGHSQNARLAVGALGLRIVVASFELFESLLVTGVVLVTMGGLALAWSKWKWTPAADGGEHHV